MRANEAEKGGEERRGGPGEEPSHAVDVLVLVAVAVLPGAALGGGDGVRAPGRRAFGGDAVPGARAGGLVMGPLLQLQAPDGEGICGDGGQQWPGQGDSPDAGHEERQGRPGLQGRGLRLPHRRGNSPDHRLRRIG